MPFTICADVVVLLLRLRIIIRLSIFVVPGWLHCAAAAALSLAAAAAAAALSLAAAAAAAARLSLAAAGLPHAAVAALLRVGFCRGILDSLLHRA